MWFLAGVGSDVSSLMFKSVEGFLAQRALIRSRQILSVVVLVWLRIL